MTYNLDFIAGEYYQIMNQLNPHFYGELVNSARQSALSILANMRMDNKAEIMVENSINVMKNNLYTFYYRELTRIYNLLEMEYGKNWILKTIARHVNESLWLLTVKEFAKAHAEHKRGLFRKLYEGQSHIPILEGRRVTVETDVYDIDTEQGKTQIIELLTSYTIN